MSLRLVSLLLHAACAPVTAAHVDILLWQESGRLQAGAIDFATSRVLPDHRVFAEPLDPVPGYSGFVTTSAPGWNALRNTTLLPPTASLLPPSSPVGFNILGLHEGSGPSLLWWSGQGDVHFAAPPAGEVLQYRLFDQAVTLDATTGPVSGYRIATASPGGYLHVHADFNLYGGYPLSDTSADQPSSGVYLLSMEATAGNLTPSPPFYLLLGHGVETSALHAAREWSLRTSAVPEPGILLFALTMLPVTHHRRRRQCIHFSL